MAENDVKGLQAPEIGAFTRHMVARPRTIALSLFGASFVIAILSYARGAPTINLGTGWSDRRSIEQKRYDGLLTVQADAFVVEEDSKKDDDASDDVQDTRTIQLDKLAIVYDAFEGGDMLSLANMNKVIDVERALLDSEGWPSVCQLVHSRDDEEDPRCASPTTVLNYLYVNDDKHEEDCTSGFCVVDDETRDLICGDTSAPACAFIPGGCRKWGDFPCRSTVYDWRDGDLLDPDEWAETIEKKTCEEEEWQKRILFDKKFDCDDPAARYLRSFYYIGGPVEGYDNVEDDAFNQIFGIAFGKPMRDVKRALNGNITQISATSADARAIATEPDGNKTISILWDAIVALKPIDALIVDMLLALLSIVLVFLIIWRNVGSLFLAVCGIVQINLAFPMTLFMWRVLGMQNDIDFMQAMTVYLVLCIGADDIFVFVDSWKATATMPAIISGSLETRFAHAYKTAASAMLTTTLTTVFALAITATAPVPTIQGFGIFAAVLITINYLLVISFFPACVIVHAKHIDHKLNRRILERAPWLSCCPCLSSTAKHLDDQPPRERRVVAVLRDHVAPFLNKWRFAFLAASLSLLAGAITADVLLFELAEEFPRDFADNHPLSAVPLVQRHNFYVAEDWKHVVYTVYGLDTSEPVTYRNTGQLFPPFGENGDENWVAADFNKDTQEAIVGACEAAKADEDLVRDGEAFCLLRDLKRYAVDSFPYETESDLRDALDAFYESTYYTELVTNYTGYSAYTGFVADGDSGIRGYWQSYNSTIPLDLDNGPQLVQPYFDQWETFTREECREREHSPDCFQMLPLSWVDPYRANWIWSSLLSALFRMSIVGTGASLACAYFVLLAVTRNVITSTLAIFTIMSVIVTVGAFIFLVGYQFGMFESILLILTIGLSVDYCVHLSHFYEMAKGTRFERAQKAIAGVGISVINGAMTTFCAGLPLAASVFVFFQLFGFFIFATSFFAILYSYTLLLPLLMTFGPEGDQGSLDALARYLGLLKPKATSTATTVGVDGAGGANAKQQA